MAVYKNKSNNTWFIKVRINGKSTTRHGFKTKIEAMKAEIAIKENRTLICPSKLDEIAEQYIMYLKLNENSSAYTVESVYRNHIKDCIGDKRLDKIKLKDMKELQLKMLKKTHCKGKHYTNKTINLVTGTLNMILNFAVKNECISNNPCSNFKALKIIKTSDEIVFWTDTEFKKAIQYERDFIWYCFLTLAYMTGMRKGEIRGLRWSDIDFDKHIIYIKRHISDKVMKEDIGTDRENRVIKGRKNGNEHRISMDIHVEKLLKKLKYESSFIDGWNKDCYVFGVYQPVGQNTPKRHLDEIAKLANVRRITVHGLRHSHVSYLISKGLNAYEIAERIGDTVEMVFQVYGHMFPNPQKNIINVLNNDFEFLNYDPQLSYCSQNCSQIIIEHEKNPENIRVSTFAGALDKTRTCDLPVNSRMLYRLSY